MRERSWRRLFALCSLLLAGLLMGGWANAIPHQPYLLALPPQEEQATPVPVDPPVSPKSVPEVEGLAPDSTLLPFFPREPESHRSPAPTVAEPQPTLSLPDLHPPVRLTIPSLAITAPVRAVDLAADGSLDITSEGDVVFWYRGSAYPGWPGRTLIAGHFDLPDGSWGVFARLHLLHTGDEVLVERSDGSTVRYTVAATERYPSDALPTDLVGPGARAELVLITCSGWWQPAQRRYSENLVVIALKTPDA